jgi:hypothetical protein
MVTFTIQIGTDPVAIDQYMAPGMTRDFPISFVGFDPKATVQGGDLWLSVLVTQVTHPGPPQPGFRPRSRISPSTSRLLTAWTQERTRERLKPHHLLGPRPFR